MMFLNPTADFDGKQAKDHI